VQVLLFCAAAELKGDAAIHHRIIARMGLPLEVCAGPGSNLEIVEKHLAAAEWVVDALFGTGLSGPVRPPFDAVIAAINRCPARVLAADIPSGLDCDTGEPLGPTVRAHHTVTFAAHKVGFANPAAQQWLGQVHVADIGIAVALLDGRPPMSDQHP
jgi:NAD(P)H-hydrate epimerase